MNGEKIMLKNEKEEEEINNRSEEIDGENVEERKKKEINLIGGKMRNIIKKGKKRRILLDEEGKIEVIIIDIEELGRVLCIFCDKGKLKRFWIGVSEMKVELEDKKRIVRRDLIKKWKSDRMRKRSDGGIIMKEKKKIEGIGGFWVGEKIVNDMIVGEVEEGENIEKVIEIGKDSVNMRIDEEGKKSEKIKIKEKKVGRIIVKYLRID